MEYVYVDANTISGVDYGEFRLCRRLKEESDEQRRKLADKDEHGKRRKSHVCSTILHVHVAYAATWSKHQMCPLLPVFMAIDQWQLSKGQGSNQGKLDQDETRRLLAFVSVALRTYGLRNQSVQSMLHA